LNHIVRLDQTLKLCK